MKLSLKTFVQIKPSAVRTVRAFTLVEMMVAMAIFSMVIAATVSSQLFGLRMYRISDAKLSVSGDARVVLNHLREEVWTGKLLYVGNGNSSAFTLVADNTPHCGNAIRICPTTDTNNFIYYFMDSADSSLKRMVSGSAQIQTVARNVTNLVVFRAEDFQGNTLSNYLNNRVIRMQLQMRKPEYFGGLAEYYQLQTRLARRAID